MIDFFKLERVSPKPPTTGAIPPHPVRQSRHYSMLVILDLFVFWFAEASNGRPSSDSVKTGTTKSHLV